MLTLYSPEIYDGEFYIYESLSCLGMKNSFHGLYIKICCILLTSAFVISTLLATMTLTSTGYASSEAYDSGYNHGCDDAGISDPADRYINQPEKGPSFHTDRFMDGYNDGFDACSGTNDNSSSSSASSSSSESKSENESTSSSSQNGFFTERGFVVQPKSDRPTINEDFNPDSSCMFDAYQFRCIPGANQECPEGFGNNDDSTCFFLHKEGCPEGYHSTDNDETGQCYSNEEGCNAYATINGTRYDYILLTDRPGKGDICADPRFHN
jgi:hypothetical protein